jgi:hypothetical protein
LQSGWGRIFILGGRHGPSEGAASSLELSFLQLFIRHHQELILAHLVAAAAVAALNDLTRHGIDELLA